MRRLDAQLALFLCFCVIVQQQVSPEALFELRLKRFLNELGRDSTGSCCGGGGGDGSGAVGGAGGCGDVCRTKFRVCLKHYLAVVDPSGPCTFGDVVTPVVANNSVDFLGARVPDSTTFRNPIVFPVEFSWPETFSLIIEAWHENDPKVTAADAEPASLIARVTAQRWLSVKEEWTTAHYVKGHVSLAYEFRVRCAMHYYGKTCSRLCRPRDDVFGHYKCTASGEKICFPGWTGEYCDKAICSSGCHPKHGSCSAPNECVCKSGWEGPLCDRCVRYPGCEHGTCQKPWECVCEEGWGGLFCNQDLNYCTNHRPCKNGGTCYNTGQGSFTCSCPEEYTGSSCELEVNHCAEQPCVNGGTCYVREPPTPSSLSLHVHVQNTGANYTCSCRMGWHGRKCELRVNSCADEPCKHGGVCTDNAAGYQCGCQAGYDGVNCERQLDLCRPNPCKNGHCVTEGDGYRCSCPVGFAGVNCEVNIDDCAGENRCHNGGTCVDLVNSFKCLCVPGFIGSLCLTNVNECVSKPCANGGQCFDLVNDYRCACPSGFAGKDCSLQALGCESHRCKNGGTCVSSVSEAGVVVQCSCAQGFFGASCEFLDELSNRTQQHHRHSFKMGGVIQKLYVVEGDRSDLSSEQLVLIATLSAAVPLLAFASAVVIVCMKRKRKRDRKKADDEARRQNVENAVCSMMNNNKCSVDRRSQIIVNDLDYSIPDKPTNSYSPFHQVYRHIDSVDCCSKDSVTAYAMRRSSKILNSDPSLRTSVLGDRCSYDPDPSYAKIPSGDVNSPYPKVCLGDVASSSSCLSVDANPVLCSSDCSPVKKSVDFATGATTPSSCSSSPASYSVYVIHDKLSEPIFATEV